MHNSYPIILETGIMVGVRQGISQKGVYVMTVGHEKVCAVTDSRLLDKLTSEAEFSCARCGAIAHGRDNVCEPIPFEPDH